MAVHTSVFGGVRLNGKDAEAFRKQIDSDSPKQAAVNALKSGRAITKTLNEQGFVSVKTKR